jgi:hypothetical protein
MPQVNPTIGPNSNIGEVFGQALRGLTQVANIYTSHLEDENKKKATERAIVDFAAQNTQQQQIKLANAETDVTQANTQLAEHEYQRNLFIQRQGIPGLLATTPPDYLGNILNEHPELLPETQSMIADEIAGRFAKEDAANVAAAIARDPGGTDINALSNDVRTKRLAAMGDEKTKAAYSLAFDATQADISANALLMNAKADASKAADAAIGSYGDGFVKGIRYGVITPQVFDERFNEMVSKVQRYIPSASVEDIRAKAFNNMQKYISGAVSLGISLTVLQKQFTSLSNSLGDKYPELLGFSAMIDKEVATRKIETAKTVTDQLDTFINASDNKKALTTALAQAKLNADNGIISPIQYQSLVAAHDKQLDTISKHDDVMKALGVSIDDAGNYKGDFINSNDNVSLTLGSEHDKAIEQIATKLGLTNEARYQWELSNFNRLTDQSVKEIADNAEIPDVAHFATSLNAYLGIWAKNPAYAQSLVDNKKLPQRLEIAANLSTLGGQDIGAVLQKVAPLSDLSIANAAKLIAPKSAKERQELGIDDSMLKNYFDISRKLDAKGNPSANAQQLYRAAFMLNAAKFEQMKGDALPKDVLNLPTNKQRSLSSRKFRLLNLATRSI